VGSRGLN